MYVHTSTYGMPHKKLTFRTVPTRNYIRVLMYVLCTYFDT